MIFRERARFAAFNLRQWVYLLQPRAVGPSRAFDSWPRLKGLLVLRFLPLLLVSSSSSRSLCIGRPSIFLSLSLTPSLALSLSLPRQLGAARLYLKLIAWCFAALNALLVVVDGLDSRRVRYRPFCFHCQGCKRRNAVEDDSPPQFFLGWQRGIYGSEVIDY